MALAITIKPQHLWNILNGLKKGEIRKNKGLVNAIKKEIAEKSKATIYCICSKNKPYMKQCKHFRVLDYTEISNEGYYLNGKVVCKFECEKVEELYTDENGMSYYTDTIIEDYEVSKLACVDDVDIEEYLNGDIGYFIHISNLKIFNKAKEIKELMKPHNTIDIAQVKCPKKDKGMCNWGMSIKQNKWIGCNKFRLTKAPQNFVYVEDTL